MSQVIKNLTNGKYIKHDYKLGSIRKLGFPYIYVDSVKEAQKFKNAQVYFTKFWNTDEAKNNQWVLIDLSHKNNKTLNN